MNVSCVEISDTKIKCNFRKSNKAPWSSQNFTLRGASIQDQYNSKSKGNYNKNDGIITWYWITLHGSSFFTKWNRPHGYGNIPINYYIIFIHTWQYLYLQVYQLIYSKYFKLTSLQFLTLTALGVTSVTGLIAL